MSPDELPHDAQRAVKAYADRLLELVRSCADHQRADPEVFLWNARRALETICHILHTVDERKPSRTDRGHSDRSLDQALQQLQQRLVLDEQQVTRLHAIRRHTNLGVHIRRPEREDYPTAVADLRHMLPAAIEWLLRDSAAASALGARPELTIALNEIRGGGRPAAETQLSAAQWQKRCIALEARLAELEQTEEVVEDHATPPYAVVPRVTGFDTDPGFEPVLPAPPPRRRPPLLAIGSAALAGAATRPDASSQPPAAPAASPEPSSAPAARPAAASLCPDGMIHFAASTLHLSQPLGGGRGDWPEPSAPTLAPVAVPGFCVDRAPRTKAQFRDWDGSAQTDPTSCAWDDPGFAESAPVVCVDRDSASHYCASLTPPAQLPALTWWEVMARAEGASDAEGGPVREWADDLFPPAVLLRRPEPCSDRHCAWGLFRERLKSSRRPAADGNVLWGWHDQETGNGWNNLAFRCAIEDGAGGA